MRTTSIAATTAVLSALVLGCSRGDRSGDAAGQGATAASNATAASPATTSGDTIVRGTLKEVSDSALSLTTSSGDVRVALAQPVTVYARNPADLSRMTDHSFVGVTSVPQPDGTQRATEIHIFPEELRGLGEGSRPMDQAGGGSRSTMTNGSVAGSRMTNGAARMTNGAARMTNGTSRGAGGGAITVAYNGGSQTITVPAGVAVTAIEATTTRLTPGTSVVVLASRQPDGTLKASRVMLAGGAQPPR
jgi:hypothetical protein